MRRRRQRPDGDVMEGWFRLVCRQDVWGGQQVDNAGGRGGPGPSFRSSQCHDEQYLEGDQKPGFNPPLPPPRGEAWESPNFPELQFPRV